MKAKMIFQYYQKSWNNSLADLLKISFSSYGQQNVLENARFTLIQMYIIF